MLEPTSVDARARVALYLSVVARKARRWFLESRKKDYGRFRLTWSMNVGVPSSGFDNPDLEQGFIAAARAAWVLSMESETPGLDMACDAVVEQGGQEDLPVYVVPEIVATAEGYRRSAFANPGVHVMMDVGASTLDACAFILSPGTSGNPFGGAVPVVEQLGAAVLHEARIRALDGSAGRGSARAIDPRDPGSAVPDALSEYVAPGQPVPTTLSALDVEFCRECELTLRRALGGMYTLNPLARYRGCPLFLTGGGGRMALYRRAVENVRASGEAVAWSDVVPRPLETPDDLRPVGLSPSDVLRLMVAYGLSYPRPDFGTFVNVSTIRAIEPPPRRRFEDWYISKDDV